MQRTIPATRMRCCSICWASATRMPWLPAKTENPQRASVRKKRARITRNHLPRKRQRRSQSTFRARRIPKKCEGRRHWYYCGGRHSSAGKSKLWKRGLPTQAGAGITELPKSDGYSRLALACWRSWTTSISACPTCPCVLVTATLTRMKTTMMTMKSESTTRRRLQTKSGQMKLGMQMNGGNGVKVQLAGRSTDLLNGLSLGRKATDPLGMGVLLRRATAQDISADGGRARVTLRMRCGGREMGPHGPGTPAKLAMQTGLERTDLGLPRRRSVKARVRLAGNGKA
mmetsp:Transcript_17093/g.39865  ORF Transcript_17093/g.39865 Transcript_17093/m.39865 type:complete len:285 (+) Transcript_17093:438-1292(+)